MRSLPPRRFTLFDAMALIAATAVALAIAHPMSLPGLIGLAAGPGMLRPKRLFLANLALDRFAGLMGIFAPILLILGLRRPRPPRRRLVRRPGLLACAAWTGTFVVLALLGMIGRWIRPEIREFGFFELMANLLSSTRMECCCAIGAGWLTLAATGTWRPEPDWNDRAGRAFGGFVLVITPLTRLLNYLR